MSFPRYPKYKPSEVGWLGEVPEHWEVHRLTHRARIESSNVDKLAREGEIPVRLCNYTDVYYNDVIVADLPLMDATATADQTARLTLRADDVVFTKDSETADDIAVPAYVPRDLPGVVCGYHLGIARPTNAMSGKFLKWWFESHSARAQFEVGARGLTRVGLGRDAISAVAMASPSRAEQASIADFLDRETAKIDALAAEQERLVELLKEKRQAVISHAVTKGLNPSAPLKPSGIPWLGDVPAHWRVSQIGHVAALMVGFPFQSEKFSFDPKAGLPLVRGENVGEGWLR